MAEWRETRERLEAAGVVFARGLSSAEARAAETKCRLRFPPDLAGFLGEGLPVGKGWPNWRSPGDQELAQVRWPLEGMCFDIESNSFWLDAWGPRPSSQSERTRIAEAAIDAAPTLVPVVGHRYLPDSPHERGNPVFSVYQMDIIVYGEDLSAFFANEFPAAFGQSGYRYSGKEKSIDFWSSCL